MAREETDIPKYLRYSSMKVHYGAEDFHNTTRNGIGKVWVVDVFLRTCANFLGEARGERMRVGSTYGVSGGLGYPTT